MYLDVSSRAFIHNSLVVPHYYFNTTKGIATFYQTMYFVKRKNEEKRTRNVIEIVRRISPDGDGE